MTYLDRAREYFAKDIFSTQLMGTEIVDVQEGYAKCSLALCKKHLNAEGNVMGGVLFTLADFAFAVAANLNQPTTVSLSCQIAFLSPPRGKILIAEARRVRAGYSTCYYDVEVKDEEGNMVSVVGVTGFIKRPHEG